MLKIKELIVEIINTRFDRNIEYKEFEKSDRIYTNSKNGIVNVCDVLNALTIEIKDIKQNTKGEYIIVLDKIKNNTIWNY